MDKRVADIIAKNKRIEWLDYLKAFACFLVLACHLLQSLDQANLNKHTEITSIINTIVYLFHMPLFMCISGYLYSIKKTKFTIKEYKKFELKKIVNLLVPYFTFQSISIILSMIFSSNVNHKRNYNDLLNMFNNPIPPYWFLYALLSIFIIVPIIEKLMKDDKIKIFTFFVILKIISTFLTTKIYFIDSILNYAIYFYFGFFINDLKETSISKDIVYTILHLTLGVVYYKYNNALLNVINETIRILFAICGIIICFNIFKKVNKFKILDIYKKYTLQIFLLHTICAAFIRVILLKIGVRNYWIHLTFGILASIYITVIISKICEKTMYLNFFFYPIKTLKRIRSNENVRKEA